jgi:hypothetical protein
MTRDPILPAALVLGLVLFTSRVALAGTGGCTEETYGAACDYDGTSPCSGVCLPDFSQTGAPMACLVADATALNSLSYHGAQLTSLDGAGCSTSGAVGSDCAHTCMAGACVAQNATAGAECQPAGGANVCNGACDGHGTCSSVVAADKYGRSQSCVYVACEPLDNSASGTIEFPNPTGMSCDPQDPCMMGATCSAEGICFGTPISGCMTGGADGGLGANGGGGTSAGGSSSGGCAVGVLGWKTSAGSVALFLALMTLARRRRRPPTT